MLYFSFRKTFFENLKPKPTLDSEVICWLHYLDNLNYPKSTDISELKIYGRDNFDSLWAISNLSVKCSYYLDDNLSSYTAGVRLAYDFIVKSVPFINAEIYSPKFEKLITSTFDELKKETSQIAESSENQGDELEEEIYLKLSNDYLPIFLDNVRQIFNGDSDYNISNDENTDNYEEKNLENELLDAGKIIFDFLKNSQISASNEIQEKGISTDDSSDFNDDSQELPADERDILKAEFEVILDNNEKKLLKTIEIVAAINAGKQVAFTSKAQMKSFNDFTGHKHAGKVKHYSGEKNSTHSINPADSGEKLHHKILESLYDDKLREIAQDKNLKEKVEAKQEQKDTNQAGKDSSNNQDRRSNRREQRQAQRQQRQERREVRRQERREERREVRRIQRSEQNEKNNLEEIKRAEEKEKEGKESQAKEEAEKNDKSRQERRDARRQERQNRNDGIVDNRPKAPVSRLFGRENQNSLTAFFRRAAERNNNLAQQSEIKNNMQNMLSDVKDVSKPNAPKPVGNTISNQKGI